jgi:hypothetical protein
VPKVEKFESLILFNPTNILLNQINAKGKSVQAHTQSRKTFLKTVDETILDGFFGSKRHQILEKTIPENQKPAYFFAIYADGLDRDLMGHSTQLNKLHVTFLKLLTENQLASGLRDDYSLVQIAYEGTFSKYGYNSVYAALVSQINQLVETGLVINGKIHAVRLAYLMGDGLEKAKQTGFPASFANVKFFDPLSKVNYVTF